MGVSQIRGPRAIGFLMFPPNSSLSQGSSECWDVPNMFYIVMFANVLKISSMDTLIILPSCTWCQEVNLKTIDLKIHECWKVKSAKMPQQPGGSLPEVGACLSRMVETVEDVALRGFMYSCSYIFNSGSTGNKYAARQGWRLIYLPRDSGKGRKAAYLIIHT